MKTLVWIGFCQGLFAALLMFTKKRSSASDKILSAWLTLLSIEFLTCGLDYEIFNEPLLSSSFLLFNPALFLYIKSLTVPNFKLRLVQLLHLLPYLVFEVFAYTTQELFDLTNFFEHDNRFIYRMSFSIANVVSWMVYNPISIIYVHKHRMNLHNEQSTIKKNENLGWVLFVSIFYVVYCIVALLLAGTVYFGKLYPLIPHIYNYSILLFLVYVLSFYGLYQTKLPAKLLSKEIKKTPYKNSSLNEEMKRTISKMIIEYIETQKAYLNPDLSMDILSSDLKVPKYQLTEVLNTVIGQNFFRFVNKYRVDAVKKMLADSNNKFSIEAIGFECGFASKTAFYSVFKDFTGKTPLTYRNK